MLKVILLSSFGFATFASLFSLLFYFGDWQRLGFIFVLGLFLGLIAAPEFEPKVFKHPTSFQLFGGLVFGMLLGIFLKLDISNIIAVSAIGAFLGGTASYWVKHVPIP